MKPGGNTARLDGLVKRTMVLTVTKRRGWWDQAVKSYRGQTVRPYWLVVSEPGAKPDWSQHYHVRESAEWIAAPPARRVSNLNASLNRGLFTAADNINYIIFWQDFIELQPSTFERLITHARNTGGFVTTATINPDGTNDHRYTGMNGLRELDDPAEWEANVAIAPMQALRELGGFDEEYDDGWSWDNRNVAERAAMLGYKFYIDESLRPELAFHVKVPDEDPTLQMNAGFHAVRMGQTRDGLYPIRLPYLDMTRDGRRKRSF